MQRDGAERGQRAPPAALQAALRGHSQDPARARRDLRADRRARGDSRRCTHRGRIAQGQQARRSTAVATRDRQGGQGPRPHRDSRSGRRGDPAPAPRRRGRRDHRPRHRRPRRVRLGLAETKESDDSSSSLIVAPNTRYDRYRCSLPGLAEFTAFASLGTEGTLPQPAALSTRPARFRVTTCGVLALPMRPTTKEHRHVHEDSPRTRHRSLPHRRR